MHCKLIARAIYEYTAQTEDELSFNEGDIFYITDDTDAEWWTAVEKSKNGDETVFEESKTGLVPVNYVEEAEPLAIVRSFAAYEASTAEEISFPEGALMRVYEMNDADWWVAKYDYDVGLIPASYVETEGQAGGEEYPVAEEDHHAPYENGVVESTPTPTTGDAPADLDPNAQKEKLMSALGGFGFVTKKSEPKPPKEDFGPDDIKYFPVTEVDKKKKKNNRKGFMGISDDFGIYFVSNDRSRDILSKWMLTDVTKFSEKKGKKIILEFGAEAREFEGEKADIQALHARLEQVHTKSTMSGPILNGPPPVFIPPTAPSPVAVPAPARPPISPSPAAAPSPPQGPRPSPLPTYPR
ncbi:cytoskeletal protein binding protein, partial [Borealophlyctis nickersoniae]